ncbi:unnamed protein product [Vicia faba]|uniref:Uncharacterized protein n=1 Tax=Vicia faba TaxID=3906 RepID=A0AAV1ALZ0_VICFA|nr:unnamed protein product [Vicia faba]
MSLYSRPLRKDDTHKSRNGPNFFAIFSLVQVVSIMKILNNAGCVHHEDFEQCRQMDNAQVDWIQIIIIVVGRQHGTFIQGLQSVIINQILRRAFGHQLRQQVRTYEEHEKSL